MGVHVALFHITSCPLSQNHAAGRVPALPTRAAAHAHTCSGLATPRAGHPRNGAVCWPVTRGTGPARTAQSSEAWSSGDTRGRYTGAMCGRSLGVTECHCVTCQMTSCTRTRLCYIPVKAGCCGNMLNHWIDYDVIIFLNSW